MGAVRLRSANLNMGPVPTAIRRDLCRTLRSVARLLNAQLIDHADRRGLRHCRRTDYARLSLLDTLQIAEAIGLGSAWRALPRTQIMRLLHEHPGDGPSVRHVNRHPSANRAVAPTIGY